MLPQCHDIGCHLGGRQAFENQGKTVVGLWLVVEDRVRKGEGDREEKRRKENRKREGGHLPGSRV